MTDNEKIRSSFDRVKKALQQKPAFGFGTGVSKATITNGLTCKVQEGNWKFVADMPEQAGGNAAGPTPGVFGRAALASCLAIGYTMRAAASGISFNELEVEVQADYDDGALFGTSPDTPPGYLEIRYTVRVQTDATEKEVNQILDEADKHSPYLDVFSRGQICKRTVQFISTKNA
jgi:uncharacterized OsmC-like protein